MEKSQIEAWHIPPGDVVYFEVHSDKEIPLVLLKPGTPSPVPEGEEDGVEKRVQPGSGVQPVEPGMSQPFEGQ